MHRRILSAALSAALALALSSGAFAQGHDHAAMNMPASGAKAKPAAFAAPAAFKAQLDGVYTAYLALQASLSGDAFAKVGPNTQAFTQALQKVDMKLLTDNQAHMAWMTAAASMTKFAAQVGSAKDIDAARAGFKPLSEAVISTAKGFGTSGKTPLYVLHCPMALKTGADWVQADKTVKNPYFGKAMLACGTVTGTLSAGSGK